MKTRITFIFALLLCAAWMMPAKAQDLGAGKKLLETGQINKAHQFFLNQVASNPGNAEARFYLAETYFNLGKRDSAAANYQRGLEANKKFAFNEAGLGRIELVKGDTTKAKEIFNSAIKSDKKNVDLYAYIAKSAVAANQPKIAAWYIAKGKDVSVKNGNIHMAEGDLAALKGIAGEAVNAYERVNDYDKNNPLAYVKIGNIFTDARTYGIAEENYKKALAIDPNYPLAFKGLGDMNYKRGDFKAASENYKKYLSLSEQSLEDTYRYAFILFYNKEYSEATKILQELLQKDPNNPVLLRLQAYISYELGVDEKEKVTNPEDIQKALASINKFMQVQDKDKFLSSDYEYLAKIQMASGLKDQAPGNFMKAFQLDTTKVEFVEKAADAYNKAEKFDSAAITYDKLARMSENNQAYRFFYSGLNYYLQASQKDTAAADSLVKKEHLILADSAFKKVADLSPNSHLGSFWMARAELMLDKNQVGLASNSYQKVIDIITANNEQAKRKSELMEAYNYFASLYYVKAYNARAIERNNTAYLEARAKSLDYWNKMLEINPNDPKAAEGIKAVNDLAKIQTKPTQKPQQQQ